jgi:DNA-binding NarL/FixJ family response regulator
MDILVYNHSASAGVSSSRIPTTKANPNTEIDDSNSATNQPKTDTLEISTAAYEKLAQISTQSTATAESSAAVAQSDADTGQSAINTRSTPSAGQSQGNRQSVESTNQTQTDTESSTSTDYTSKSTQAEELYQKGKTVEQIAQSLNVDVATVERYLGVTSTT